MAFEKQAGLVLKLDISVLTFYFSLVVILHPTSPKPAEQKGTGSQRVLRESIVPSHLIIRFRIIPFCTSCMVGRYAGTYIRGVTHTYTTTYIVHQHTHHTYLTHTASPYRRCVYVEHCICAECNWITLRALSISYSSSVRAGRAGLHKPCK